MELQPSTVFTTVPTPTTRDELLVTVLGMYKEIVDRKTFPTEVDAWVRQQEVTVENARETVRYAHARLAEGHQLVYDCEADMDQRGLYGKQRGYGRQVEEGQKRAQHRDDEAWILSASRQDLFVEARTAINER